MKCVTQLAMCLAMTLGCGVGSASAQSTGATTPRDHGYAEFTAGATFGHKSSASFGAEGGYWLFDMFGVFGEAGRMQDVVTTQIETKAQIIGGHIGATVEAKQPLTYVDGGFAVRFHAGPLTPYVLVGIGTAKVENNVTFRIGGTDVTGRLDQSPYNVQLGGDLSGDYRKVFGTAGLGAHITIAGRWIGDVSYRFGRIGAYTESELKAINTNRLQFGIGAKF